MTWDYYDIQKEEKNPRYFSDEMIAIEKILNEILELRADHNDLDESSIKQGYITEQVANNRSQTVKKAIVDQLEEILEEFKGKLT